MEETGECGRCVRCGFGHTEAEYLAQGMVVPQSFYNRVRIAGRLYCPDCAVAEYRDVEGIIVSQEFDGGGRWIVHGRGPNRTPKVAYFETQAAAEELAERIRILICTLRGE